MYEFQLSSQHLNSMTKEIYNVVRFSNESNIFKKYCEFMCIHIAVFAVFVCIVKPQNYEI